MFGRVVKTSLYVSRGTFREINFLEKFISFITFSVFERKVFGDVLGRVVKIAACLFRGTFWGKIFFFLQKIVFFCHIWTLGKFFRNCIKTAFCSFRGTI